jgi:hypothetical protein
MLETRDNRGLGYDDREYYKNGVSLLRTRLRWADEGAGDGDKSREQVRSEEAEAEVENPLADREQVVEYEVV